MEDISQIPVNLAQLLMRAFYWVDEGLQNGLKGEGWPSITRAQSMVFVNIGEGVTRPSEIAAKLGVTRQAVHQTINELVAMDLIKLVPDETDRRAKKVIFTDQGMLLGQAAIVTLQRVEQTLTERLGSDLAAGLRQALEQDWGKPRE